ncbi:MULTISPECIES: hypothetical protein [Protofrankia]|uniref:Glycosyltransferase RgtA/B/C/D-like domain-containing protein n=1 Tax=Candidatus Protofrankia datiscae TaxID=2716812 RepID=F8AY06_9ACTN|nr:MULTISPECIES: hypothetical protein [Protofrankia]AEH08505.1 hypothetical protein FsymDg_1000 [Candidatus Protofrankia datiscae]
MDPADTDTPAAGEKATPLTVRRAAPAPEPGATPVTEPAATGGTAVRGRRRGRLRTHTLIGSSYLLLALLLTARVWSDPTRNIISGNPNDTSLYCWWLAHTAHAVTHLSNPFVTHLANAPEGINALWNTSVLVPGLLLTPVTRAAGPVASYNLLVMLAFSLSAFSAYLLARKLRVRTAAAYVAGLVYGFSPALVAAGTGHLSLALAPAVPLLLGLVVDAVRGTHRPARTGVPLGVGVGLQLLTGEEVLFITAVTAAVGIVLLLVSRPEYLRLAGGPLRTFAIAFLTCLALTAVPLSIQFLGSLRAHGSPFLANFFKSDLTGLYVPSEHQWLATSAQSTRAAEFPGGASEYMNFLGWPLLIVCVCTVVLGFHDLRIRIAGLTGTVLAVLSLGETLLVNNVETGLRLPWGLVAGLPVFEAALPNRFSLGTALMAGLVLACALDRLPARLAAAGVPAAVALSVVCVLPLIPRPYTVERSPDVPAFFTTDAVKTLPAGSNVLLLPYPTGLRATAMSWQTVADFHFSMPGGYFIGPGHDGKAYMGGKKPTVTAQLLEDIESGSFTGPVTPAQIARSRADFAELGMRAVVLGPARHRDGLRDTVTSLTGQPPEFTGGVYVWRLP